MRPHDDFRTLNGAGSASSGSVGSAAESDDSGSGGEESEQHSEQLSVPDGAPAAALARLNQLRKSRQHCDVLLLAGGAEVAAHRAVLAAHSPHLLAALAAPPPAAPAPASPDAPALLAYRVEGVTADALRELVEYAYTGRLRLGGGGAAARALYVAAWRLRMEAARHALAGALLRHPTPHDCLELRALPDLPPDHLHALDEYIAQNFDEICASGALAALPVIRIEMLRVTSAHGGNEAAAAVADAALAWIQEQVANTTLEELCSRTHLVYVDGDGALRDCGLLPAARGDAPELQEYRREAAARERRPAGTQPRPLPGLELGVRNVRPDCAVLAARGADNGGGGRVTRALLVVGGSVAAARVCWRDVAAGEGAAGGALGGAPPGGEKLAALAEARCAHGLAALGGRLLACGGYDRARALRSAEAYCPRANAWRPLPELRGARARFPAARLGDTLYVIGGSDGHNELDSVDTYRETAAGGKWAAGSRLPLAVSHAGAAAVPAPQGGGSIFVVGGWAGGRPLRSVLRFEPDSGEWHQAPPLNTARSQCAAVWWEGHVWALGGCDAWHCLATTERLSATATAAATAAADGDGAQWETGPPLPTARRSVGGCAWRGRLWAAGGSDGAASLRAVACLRAGAAGWAAGPSLRRPRAALALAELDDVLYAVGGFDGKEFLSCVECLYSPTGQWTALRAPPRPAPPLPVVSSTQSLQLEEGEQRGEGSSGSDGAETTEQEGEEEGEEGPGWGEGADPPPQ